MPVASSEQPLLPMLVIDSALAGVGVAVLDQGDSAEGSSPRILASDYASMQRGHAETVVPMAQQLLKTVDMAAQSLAAVVVTVGPGSFTGLRVGLAAGHGFALALSIPLLGISVTDVLRAQLTPLNRLDRALPPTVAVVGNRGQDVFVQYVPKGSGLQDSNQPILCLSIAALCEQAAKWPAPPVFVGDSDLAWTALQADKRVQADRGPSQLDPRWIGMVAWARGLAGARAPDPLYGRAPDVSAPARTIRTQTR